MRAAPLGRSARDGCGSGRRWSLRWVWVPLLALAIAGCGEDPARDGDARLVDLRDDVLPSTIPTTTVMTGTSAVSAGPVPSYVPPDLKELPLNPVPTRPVGGTRPAATSTASSSPDAQTSSTTGPDGSTTSTTGPATSTSSSTSGEARPQRLTIDGLTPTRRLDQSPVAVTVVGLGGPVLAELTASGGCSVAGGAVTLSHAGACTVVADAPAQNGYRAASASTTFIVTKGQAVLTAALADGARYPYTPGGVAVGATATAGRPVTITAPAGGGCSVAGGRVLVGSAAVPACSVTLAIAGDDDWEPASRTITFSFVPAPVTWTVEWAGTDPVDASGAFTLRIRLTQPDAALDADALGRFSARGTPGQCSDGVRVGVSGRVAMFSVTASAVTDRCDLTIGFAPFEWYLPAGPGALSVPITHAAVGPPPTPTG